MKYLVCYYSRTGSTKKVASMVSEVLKCDDEPIVDMQNRDGFFEFFRCIYQARKEKMTTIKLLTKDPKDYDLVIIATPIWAGKITPAIRTFISKYKTMFKEVAFICTSGSGKNEKGFADMEKVCGKKTTAKVEFKEMEVKEDKYIEKMNQFIKDLKSHS